MKIKLVNLTLKLFVFIVIPSTDQIGVKMPTIVSTGGNRATCPNCGSVMTYTRDEVKPGGDLPGTHERASVIFCPKCRKSIDVTGQVGYASAGAIKRQQDSDDYWDHQL